MSYKKKKIEYLTVEEFMVHLSWCRKYRTIVLGPRVGKDMHKYQIANIEQEVIRLKLTYRKCNQTVTYITRLDGGEEDQKIDGVLAYSTLQKYYKVPDLSEDETFDYHKDKNGKVTWCITAMQQLQYYDKERNFTRTKKCYGYDLNSSFSYAMLKPIPDTSQPARFYGNVKPGEIGFMHSGEVVFKGRANIIFPLMESPFKKFVTVWYKRKMNAKNPEEKAKAKQMLNYCIGYMQRKNPFIRNTIVWRSNEYIKEMMDHDTLYCNTDSIVSAKRRKDIEANLGQDIGQWKIEHKGEFAYKGFTYQWNHDVPTYKGVAKEWFKQFRVVMGRDWDLLIDKPPREELNEFFFNSETFEIERRKIKNEESKEN